MGKQKNYGTCCQCDKPLSKNDYGISVKFYGELSHKYCIGCIADQLSVTVDDILNKIEEYKDEGCKLFQ